MSAPAAEQWAFAGRQREITRLLFFVADDATGLRTDTTLLPFFLMLPILTSLPAAQREGEGEGGYTGGEVCPICPETAAKLPLISPF